MTGNAVAARRVRRLDDVVARSRIAAARRENPAVGSDVNADGNSSPDRPFVDGVMAGRNSYEGPDYASVNMRLSKRFRFDGRRALLLQFEAFNLFNRTNYGGLNMTWGTGADPPNDTYGTYTSANAPRQLQLGVKFEF